MTQRTWALLSFSEKYQWPEAARVRLEISPPIQNSGKLCSNTSRAMRFRSLTLKIRGAEPDSAVSVSIIS